MMDGNVHVTRRHGWLLLILFTAALLRLYDIGGTPPGLTHDEADHGITAWEVVNGARQIYFTVGYGREPLFDYSTAVLMSLSGPTFLAGRLTAVYFGLILVAAMFAWTRQAFGNTTALLAAAGLAVGFWAVMTSRQSLRSITLPTLFVLVLYFYWRGLKGKTCHVGHINYSPFAIAGILLGLTFYTYIPARILWLIFPVMLGYMAVAARCTLRRVWLATLLMLLLAALLGLPLFYYLYTHPGAEVRIEQLSAPLTALLQGNPVPLWHNSLASLGLFTVSGDTFWRYNIPGRPLLTPVLGSFFYLGLVIAIWRSLPLSRSGQKSTAYAAALSWLVAAMLPTLVTGPELSTTQSIGMQPALYLFSAIGMTFLGQVLGKQGQSFISAGHLTASKRWTFIVPLLLFVATAVVTARDYFIHWATAPEVRVQYETTMVTAMRYLNSSRAEAVTVSTATPDRFHSPAVAQMTLRPTSTTMRWFDGRHSLVLPTDKQSLLVETGFARLSPLMAGYLSSAELIETVSLPATDLDRPLNIYQVNGPALSTQWLRQFSDASDGLGGPVDFGETAEFLGYDLRTPSLAPGEQVQLLTLWRVKKPLIDALLFTHIQGTDGLPVAQADQLSVPGHAWYPGDLFIQLHEIELPQSLNAGLYPIVVGLCQQSPTGCTRLPILGGDLRDSILFLTDLSVTQ